MKGNARVLRKSQTDAERLLWHHLRDRRLAGHKFRRQHPIGAFIVDFVCIERRLVVKLDGGQHGLQVEEDNRRSTNLKSKGYEVVRFWNDQVLKETQAVLEEILRIIESDTPSHPTLSPVTEGEGRQHSQPRQVWVKISVSRGKVRGRRYSHGNG